MKKIAKADQIKLEIDAYEKHFTGAPLVIGMDDKEEYTVLLALLKDDYGKKFAYMSDSCTVEFPPNPLYSICKINSIASQGTIIWIGAAQSSMLYGQREAEEFLKNVLGTSFSGPVVLLCPFCCNILEGIGRNYVKLGYNIVLSNADERKIPSILLLQNDLEYYPDNTVKGIRQLLQVLESGIFSESVNVITKCNLSYLAGSMYPVSEGKSSYQMICETEPAIAANTTEGLGTSEQWGKMLSHLQTAGSLTALCTSRLCSIQQLANEFGTYISEESDDRFLCFICLKVFYIRGNDYLAYCLGKADTADEFISVVYNAILDISNNDKTFLHWIRQRQLILASFDENSALMKEYCEKATIKGKNILWYLSDVTDEERAAMIHALSCYEYSFDELNEVLKYISPKLYAYIQRFIFDEFNTKVMSTDVYIHPLLTDYFQRYKLQKLMNRQDTEFVDIVENEAVKRSYTKLQARSAIVKKIDKSSTQPYFIDALGAEFLSFIQKKADEYGMQFDCYIGRCNLPSITSKNKEFYEAFPKDTVLKEEKLDEIKHQGTKYDYRLAAEPLHIFDELSVLDRDLKKMSSALALGKFKRIIILSDHGASRLAVTYQSENEKLVLSEPGQHSGRCCPTDTDPNIPYVSYEDGFAVLANYERFKGSRKADVEAHGGASLEEVVVPVIQLTLKPKEQQLFFIENVVICSIKDGSVIRMFANPPLKAPRMVVDDQSYDGEFEGDKHNVIFKMPDIRRKGQYKAYIYDGSTKINELVFETKRQTGANQLF